MELQIETLMEQLVEKGGSDLHLSAGLPPYGRFSGALRPMHEAPLAEESCNRLIFSLLNNCLLYTSPSPRDATLSRMPSSA